MLQCGLFRSNFAFAIISYLYIQTILAHDARIGAIMSDCQVFANKISSSLSLKSKYPSERIQTMPLA